MKKIYTYIILVTCVMMFASCQKEFDGILTAEIEAPISIDGKVYVNDNRYACWHDKDITDVYINGNYQTSSSIIVKDQNNAILETAAGDVDDVIQVIYPARRDKYMTEIEAIQAYSRVAGPNGVFQQKINAPMFARTKLKSSNNSLVFKNRAALVKVNITNNTNNLITIDRIVFSSTDSRQVSGYLSSDEMTDTRPIQMDFVESNSSATSITLSGINTSIEENNTDSFYIYVATLSDIQYKVQVFKQGTTDPIFERQTNSMDFVRNTLYPMNITLN